MRNLKKLLALTLSFILVLSLGVTAFAYEDGNNADAYVSISVDGQEVYSTSRAASGSAEIKVLGPETLTSIKVNDQSIPLSAMEDTLNSAQTRYVNGYSAVDGTFRIYSENYNNSRVVKIYWSGLRTGLYVTATAGYMDTYQVRTDAKPAGAVKITAPESIDVAAGSSWTATFTPASKTQTIKSMYILAGNSSREVEVPKFGSVDVSVAKQDLRITRNSDDSVTVSMSRVVNNVSITAQAYNAETTRYKLNVITDKNISSSINTDYFDVNTSREVVLTPARGYNVTRIRITDGKEVGTLLANQQSVRVNDKVYSASVKSDGRVYLTIPAMTADVTVEAFSTEQGYIVEVLGEKYVSSNHPGVNTIPYGEGFTLTFYARDNYYYTGIEVKTARGTYTASYDADRIVIDGLSYPIYRNIYGDVTLAFDVVPCDMTIAPTSRESRPGYNRIVAISDKYIQSNAYDTWVRDNDDVSVTFELKGDAQSKNDVIQQIRVKYNGKTYYANPATDDYITVSNDKWYFDVDGDGCVTVYLTDVEHDVEIYASVTEKGGSNNSGHNSGKNWKITKTSDSHSTITYTGKAPFDKGDETTVRVYTDDKYIIKNVTFTMSGKTATVKPFDKQFTLNGDLYTVNWTTNGDMNVKFDTLTSNLTVKSVAEKGDLKKPQEDIVNRPPTNDNITITLPDNTPINPPVEITGHHVAYMYGFGDGTFRPDQIMTRAEAVTVLARLHAGLTDASASSYATAASFVDVGPNDWFAGYVGYAKQAGFLDNWIGAGAANFSPNTGITRAQFVVLLCNFTQQNVVGTSTVQAFQDVPNNYWAATYINYCAARGWALGYDGTAFHPDECLTRAQICALLNRINNRVAGNTSGYMANQFLDVAATSWYFNDVMEATNDHYVSGTSNGVETWVK